MLTPPNMRHLLAAREGFEPSHGFTRLTPQQGVPFGHLGTSPYYINYEIKKQPCGWCKKLLIDIVFCSICFRNIWKRIFIPLTILLWNCRTFFIRFFTYSGGRLLRQNPQSRPQRTQAGRDYCFIRHHASCAEDVAFAIGGRRWSRTTVLGFSVRHTDRVCHPPILASFSSHKTLILCKMLDSNQPPIVYQTIALPGELISLQVVDLLDVSLWSYNISIISPDITISRFSFTISSFCDVSPHSRI